MSIINRSRVHWPWWNPLYSLNPYEGTCPHGCFYCYVDDMRSDFRQPSKPWGVRWSDKERVLREAKNDIKKVDEDAWIMFSSTCDSFSQPALESGLTLDLLREVLLPSKVGVVCLTKGQYPDSYLQLMAVRGGHDERFLVGITLTCIDPVASRTVEPGASLPVERIQRLRWAQEYGLSTMVSMEPDIPGTTYGTRIIDELLSLKEKPVIVYGSFNRRNRPRDPLYVKRVAPNVIGYAREKGFTVHIKPEVAKLIGSGEKNGD